MSVNVSAKQLTAHSLSGAASPAHFSTHLTRTLTECGLEAAHLKLEITESALLEYAKETETTLAQLRALGVTVELDDFGTGYSSLSSLQQFPIDTVKIDRSFISDGSGGGIANEEIAGAIVALALTLNKHVTAEGVETFEQLAALRKLRCTSAQGHVLSRPISAAATSAFIRSYEDSSTWSALWEAPA